MAGVELHQSDPNSSVNLEGDSPALSERCRVTFPTSDQPASTMNDFETLVKALRDRLGPCSGINDDDVDPEELQTLMKEYVSNESEWERYAFQLPSIPYTRNLVDKGNGKCNLVSLLVGVRSRCSD